MRKLIAILAVSGLIGCATQPTPAILLNTLKARDTQILDLVQVGKNLVSTYGKDRAEKLVLDTWVDMTNDSPVERAKDVLWLMSQSARVRDVAWLVQYRSEWLNP